MNNVMSSHRTRLTNQHLEDRMRLTLNGPRELHKLPWKIFAMKWQAEKGDIIVKLTNKRKSDSEEDVDNFESDLDKPLFKVNVV